MPTHRTTYDKAPVITVPGTHHSWTGASAWREIARHAEARNGLGGRGGTVILVDTYPGVDLAALKASIESALPSYEIVDLEQVAALPIEQINALIAGNLTNDRVFGVLSHHTLAQFYDQQLLDQERDRLRTNPQGTVVVGWGAGLLAQEDATLVLADMARWEIQQRYRRGAPNWRSDNGDEDNLRKVKRGYFVEWRVADRHKRSLFASIDYVLDTNSSPSDGTLITASTFHAGMAAAVATPFRVVPFFDPGVWGGQWMKDVVGLDPAAVNYAWGFDCVPEENSILLQVGAAVVELPAIDVVFTHPRELLGELTFARFGAEFPIRFDFLDTMDGGNLSLQVHPLTDYIQNHFGMHYTQDESYYLLDAQEDAVVYLGLKTGINPEDMLSALRRGAEGRESIPVADFVNTFPAKKHDHFSIPAGTVHASGAGSMVLEISATPYLFTFKMWDWDRVGLDGVPRPIHLEHAAANIQWSRDTEWTTANLVGQVETIAEGPGWVEEKTGLHEFEFIEVRRHWFTETVECTTNGTVNVLNLVEGDEAIVQSPDGSFSPFVVHYAETFIIPAAVGLYTLAPHGSSAGHRVGTVTASVRGTQRA